METPIIIAARRVQEYSAALSVRVYGYYDIDGVCVGGTPVGTTLTAWPQTAVFRLRGGGITQREAQDWLDGAQAAAGHELHAGTEAFNEAVCEYVSKAAFMRRWHGTQLTDKARRPKAPTPDAIRALEDVATARDERNAATEYLIAATHRAAEAEATNADIARHAGVVQDTVKAWHGLPVAGDVVDVIEIHRQALTALGEPFEIDAPLPELQHALSRGVEASQARGTHLSERARAVIGAALWSVHLVDDPGETEVILTPRMTATLLGGWMATHPAGVEEEHQDITTKQVAS